MIKLTITEKGGEPKALSFDKDEITIGRVSGNDIVLPKGNVSKRHSRLSVQSGQFEIADLKSTNGTYVNGRKIAEPMILSGSDRVYVGDFLITIDGLTVHEGASAARKMPVPPPPPPPRTGSSAARLPVADESTGMGGLGNDNDGDIDDAANGEPLGGTTGPSMRAGSSDAGQHDIDEEEAPLAARPPRASTRVPVPPPPPPPRRPPTPLASAALDDDGLGDDLVAPSPREIAAADDNTGAAGLFERRPAPVPADEHSSFDGAGGRPLATGRRPGAVIPPDPSGAVFEHANAAAGGADAVGPSLLDPLDALLADPGVAQIIISGPDATYVDRGSGLAPLGNSLGEPNAVADTLWRIANGAVPPPPPDNPVVDVRLPDGTRIAAVFPPTAPRGVVAAIRKTALAERALGDLCPSGARELETLLSAAVATRRNLLCTGDAGAVNTLLAAIAGAIPADRRVVSVGASAPRARVGWTDLAPAGDTPALARVAAAMRPDHLLWADGAGPEALDLLLAGARGQEGLAIALPARTPGEALARLEALAAGGSGVNGVAAAGALIASTIDLVAHVVTAPDGTARVVELAEPAGGGAGGRLAAEPVASWRSDGGKRGGPDGKLHVEGVSARLGAAFASAGTALASTLVRGG